MFPTSLCPFAPFVAFHLPLSRLSCMIALFFLSIPTTIPFESFPLSFSPVNNRLILLF